MGKATCDICGRRAAEKYESIPRDVIVLVASPDNPQPIALGVRSAAELRVCRGCSRAIDEDDELRLVERATLAFTRRLDLGEVAKLSPADRQLLISLQVTSLAKLISAFCSARLTAPQPLEES